MRTSQASQGCWTCKKRKIGCDRGLPSCNNCSRTGRECLGYGIRLIWPELHDGRRKLPKHPTQVVPFVCDHTRGPHYGDQFLNTSYEDIEQSRQDFTSLVPYGKLIVRPQYNLAFRPQLRPQEGELLQYYEERISRMITTVEANNGFRGELLPMALSGGSFAADGLFNAILALSAFHRHGPGAALPYKTYALQFLSHSLERESSVDILPQLAASMMLCVYNVFDEGEGNWHLHLNGSRSLLHQYADRNGGALDYNFLSTWFLYHEILGAFSQPHKHKYPGVSSLGLMTGDEIDKRVIIGSLGCSIEIMETIHDINEIRSIATQEATGDGIQSELPSVMWICQGLQDRLCRLKQQLPSDYSHHTAKEQTKIWLTAEFYRIAAVLYVRAVCPNIDATNQTPMWLKMAFKVLAGLEICTSPWPLFVVACESQTDQQRIQILRALDKMDEDRKIGNVFVLRSLIENYWKQQDLRVDADKLSPLRWWETMNFDTAAPWFI
ncbi:hypothetical protein N0V93_008396 [Gnomoniopsis smithogilvyi]|uniref:Zn(2)-C6 fungal-type domain-containing protein n=1 Tax=Gnomoniopsis smithogilvyi TaxID=1191159 RepID=A0A9W8YMX0_9PEZI|nr:hypothetical protein N0V93_008396 [Gnomoniopsis smithogilvyi]